MAVFKDADNREWELKLTVGALRAIRERTKIEIGKVIASERGIAELLFGDPEVFANVLWVLVEKQVQAKGITEQELAESMDGPANERAIQAMMEAIADFSPRSSVAKAIKERLPRMLERMDQTLTTEMNRLMDEAEQKLGQNPSILSGSVGGSPESSGLMPVI